MSKIYLLYILLLLMLHNEAVISQSPWHFENNDSIRSIDLAVKPSKKAIFNTVLVDQKFTIKLINQLPTKSYSVQINTVDYSMDALETSLDHRDINITDSSQSHVGKKPDKNKSTCDLINSFLKKLELSSTENDVKINMIYLETALDQYISIKDSSDCLKLLYIKAMAFLKLTSRNLGTFKLKENQILEIRIQRDTLVWKYSYSTIIRKGTWHTSYGFNGPIVGWPLKSYNYFLAGDDSNGYKIHRNRKIDWSFSPMILFSFQNNSKLENNWATGFSGGIGYDLKSPVFFFGLQHTYHQNLTVSYGICAVQTDFLRPEFKDGQYSRPVPGLIEKDQFTIKKYFPALSMGIYYRFKNNPFNNNAE
jgi:hypothetical protein